jgi:hypothetical protein
MDYLRQPNGQSSSSQPSSSETSNMQMPQFIQDGMKSINDGISNVKNSVSESVSQFSNEPGASSSFSFSNTIIAKFAFLILVLIVFMFLFNLGILLITYFTSPSPNPYLIKGMIDGTYGVIIPQDPKDKTSVPILRSNNENTGIEFTWSVWLYINDMNTSTSKFQHIFNKGDNKYSSMNNLAEVNNAPGLYLNPSDNRLHFIMNTVNDVDTNNIIEIGNIPIRKWFNVVIRMQNNILDIYINGTISGRKVLENVPKQNYDNVYVCQSGGFAGKLADLRYFNSALNVFQINQIVASGPNTTTSKLTADQKAKGNYSYLSNSWYRSKM